jgi:hypothetical protein
LRLRGASCRWRGLAQQHNTEGLAHKRLQSQENAHVPTQYSEAMGVERVIAAAQHASAPGFCACRGPPADGEVQCIDLASADAARYYATISRGMLYSSLKRSLCFDWLLLL